MRTFVRGTDITKDPSRMCYRKKAHPSEGAALEVISRILKQESQESAQGYRAHRYHAHGSASDLRAYQCPICSLWHITTKPRWEMDQVSKVPQEPPRKRCPYSKKKKMYISEQDAIDHNPKGLLVYKCTLCNAWHLTKVREGVDVYVYVDTIVLF